ncbi:MAG: hypothetical protein Ta2A_10260 [Treponemataceae bacterium]|nr:MAG: hypothetical protein Ta2A_10260 [Treponemataceae bacterium]
MRNFKLFFPVLPATLASLFLLFTSCGLQDITAVFEYAAWPTAKVIYDTGDTSLRYFDFTTGSEPTVPSGTTANFWFLGTAVYYKIYNSFTTLQTEANSITASQTTTSSNGAGFSRLVSFGYQPLNLDTNKNYYFSALSTPMQIRLYDEGYTGPPPSSDYYIYPAGITGLASPPLRQQNTKGFNFYRPTADPNPIGSDPMPDPSNSDVNFTSTEPPADLWYVNAFAVTVAQDLATFMPIYSPVIYLGYILVNP